MDNKALALTGQGYKVTVAPEVTQFRDQLIKNSAAIKTVSDNDGYQTAIKLAGELKGLEKAIERNREDVKAPINDLAKLIDGSAREFKTPLRDEITRLEKLCGDFTNKQRDEAARIQREAAASKAAEEKRLAEINAALAKAKTEKEKAKLLEKQTDAHLALQEIEEAVAEAPAAPTSAGARVQDIKFEIVVDDAAKLFAAFPEAVELKVKLSVLNDIVYRRGVRNIPGVTITQTTKVVAQSVAPSLQLK